MRNIVFALLFVSLSSFGADKKACYDVCSGMFSGQSTCVATVGSASYMDENACRICGGMFSGQNDCLKAISNKAFDPQALNVCRGLFSGQVECLKNAGRTSLAPLEQVRIHLNDALYFLRQGRVSRAQEAIEQALYLIQ